METITYLNETGELSPAFNGNIDLQTLIKGYQLMVLTRYIDDRMITLQRQGSISFAMSSLGEEACAIATAQALKPQDWIYPQYREAGIFFSRGGTPKQYIHHMFCDASDLFRGRQMPNHFGSRALNIVQVSSPIGTKIPHTAGCAYAMKLQKEEAIALAFFGEGASSEGDFHVGINFAAVRKVPAIFFCRNNGYAISTPAREQFASEGIADKGIGYGIKTMKIDGNDFFAIYDAITLARKHCLEGHGPILIEAMTYRMGAHSSSDDPTLYRDEAEVERWRAKDPILRLRLYLEGLSAWNDAEEEALQKSIANEVEQAIAEAKTCGKPPLHSLIDDVYFSVPPKLERQYEQRMHEDELCQS